MTSNELVLQHSGVKGMKWGVRKARPKGTGRPSIARRYFNSVVDSGNARMAKAGGKHAGLKAVARAEAQGFAIAALGKVGSLALGRLGVPPNVTKLVADITSRTGVEYARGATGSIVLAKGVNMYRDRKAKRQNGS